MVEVYMNDIYHDVNLNCLALIYRSMFKKNKATIKRKLVGLMLIMNFHTI